MMRFNPVSVLLCITAGFLDQNQHLFGHFLPIGTRSNSANIVSVQPNDLTLIAGDELDGAG